MNKKIKKHPFIYWLIIGLGLLIFSSALIFLLILGSHMRLSGDDYCYNAVLAQKGFWGMQTNSYFNVSMYNGNRFSLTLLSGFFGLFPIWGAFMLIATSLLAWVGGMVVLLRWFSRRFNFSLSGIEALLSAEVFASMVLWSAPSLEQSFFWRSGMLPYFLPLMGGTWVLALVGFVGEKQKQRWLSLFFILLAAVFVGGFSETGSAFWGGFWAFSLLSLLICKWLGNCTNIAQYILPAAAALIGTALAGLLLAISPSTALRLASRPEPLDFLSIVPLLAWNVRVYLWINLVRRTWMVLIPIIFGVGVGLWLIQSHRQIRMKKARTANGWKLFGTLCLVGVCALCLIACVMLPVTFIQSDYPPNRALIISQSVLVGVCISGGILVTFLIDRFIHLADIKSVFWRKLVWAICILFLSSSLLAPLQIFSEGREKLLFYSRWSNLWDMRHAKLVAAGQENVDSIHVMALDHVIEDVGELAADSDYWYNNCAEMYYGVDKIIADQSGW